MLRSTKTRITTVVATAAICLLAAAPAGAAPQQNGLVNVNVSDTTIQVPVSVAANICDVNVAVLAAFVDSNDTACTADAESLASPGASQGGGGGANQSGLVNVNLSDVLVQVPVSLAANVCDVNVAVLAQFVDTNDTACSTTADSLASPGPGQGNGRKKS